MYACMHACIYTYIYIYKYIYVYIYIKIRMNMEAFTRVFFMVSFCIVFHGYRRHHSEKKLLAVSSPCLKFDSVNHGGTSSTVSKFFAAENHILCKFFITFYHQYPACHASRPSMYILRSLVVTTPVSTMYAQRIVHFAEPWRLKKFYYYC